MFEEKVELKLSTYLGMLKDIEDLKLIKEEAINNREVINKAFLIRMSEVFKLNINDCKRFTFTPISDCKVTVEVHR